MIRPVHRQAGCPMLTGAAVFGLGIWAGAWSVEGAGLSAVAAGVAAIGAWAAPRRRAAAYGAALLLFAGFGWGRARVARPAQAVFVGWTHIDPDRPVKIRGTLRDFWTGSGDRRKTRLRAESIEQAGALRDFPANVTLFASGEAPLSGIKGDRVSLTVSMEAPEDAVSTRDLPEPSPAFRASLKSGWQIERTSGTAASIPASLNELFARRLFASSLPRRTVQEPLAALLLGRPGELDDDIAETLREGGFAHVCLATGLHVGIFATFLAGLFASCGMPRRARDIALLVAVAGFALVSAGGPSIMRVSLTLAFLLAARIAEMPVSPLQAIGASALAILALDPGDLWRFGFWLTYAASLAVALLFPVLSRALGFLPRRLRVAAAVTGAVQLAAAPLVLWRFNLIQGGGWVAAPLAIPVAGALMATGVLVLAALALHVPLAIPAWAFSAIFSTAETFAERARCATALAATPPLAAVLALLGILAAFAVAERRSIRVAAAAAYLALFSFLLLRRSPSFAPAGFSVEALDVGQGDAFLLRAGSSAFLVDGGGAFSGAENFGRLRLMPKLFDRGVKSLDGVLLSHPHPDHAGGLFSILREMPVGVFFHGDGEDDGELFARLDAVAKSAGIPSRVLKTGEELPWAGGTFSVLRSGGRPFKKDPVNNESVVLLYARGSRRVLLTGDAGTPAEKEILDRLVSLPHVDILKVGHHGSRTSSGAEFVAALSPRAALLSCGRRNRFHHPSPEALATLSRYRVSVFRTDVRSDVGFVLTPDHLFFRERGRP